MRFSLVLFFLFTCSLLWSQSNYPPVCNHAQHKASSIQRSKKLRRSTIDFNAYDLIYHRLELHATPNKFWIQGAVTSHFILRSTQDEIAFNLRNHLTVDSVKMRNDLLTFVHSNDVVSISFPSSLPQGTYDSLTVYYQGNATQGKYRSYFIENHKEGKVLATQSEPFGASDWWPCKEDLNDKFDSCDVYILTDTGYLAGGPGSLVSQSLVNDSQQLFHWQHRYPSNFYLIALAISNYELIEDSVLIRGKQVPLINYVYPQSVSTAEPLLKATIPLMEIFDSIFGPYPYLNEKYGHMQWNKGGGMEHATMSSMGGYNFDLVAHELAHQWFGNKVTCSSWQDIWINESFATYLNALAYEFMFGKDSMAVHLSKVYDIAKKENDLSIFVVDTSSIGRIFNQELSYQKGAMVLHTLRFYVGDAVFFDACRNFLTEGPNPYRSANTENFIQHLEQLTDKDVRKFINHFYYGKGYPIYLIRYSSQPNGELNLEISQSVSNKQTPFFHHSIPILAEFESGDSLLNIPINKTFQEITIQLPREVKNVQFNPQYSVMAAGNVVEVESEGDVGVQAYPNPNDGILTIESNKEQLKSVIIYNNVGQVVKEVKGLISFKTDINLALIQSEMLILVIETSNGSYVKKISKL